MRKRLIASTPQWDEKQESFLDLEKICSVEITSEDPGHPVEGALVPGAGSGWQAAGPGPQKVRLVFEEPRKIRRVRLVFEESQVERTQEFALSWVPAGEERLRGLVRQQYTFSPGGATCEIEDYAFELDGAAVLELEIVPDVSGGGTRASLVSMRVA